MPTLTVTTSNRKAFLQGKGTTGGKSKKKGSASSRFAGYIKKKIGSKPYHNMYLGEYVPTSQILFSNQATHTYLDGKEYLVVPGVPVQEQVMNTYLLPADEIKKNLDSWNNTPLSIRHAQANGGSVQVENPDVPIIGHFSNATWDDKSKRMLGDYWIDVSEASKYPEGVTIMNSIKQGQMVETSTAYWADEEFRNGSFKGRSYTSIHRNPKRDHIAIFPNDQLGACSIQDGCGLNRNESDSASQFLIVEDKDHPTTWHLKVRNPDGSLNHNLMGAAWAALHEGYRGNKYEGPNKSEAISKLKALYEREKLSLPGATQNMFANCASCSTNIFSNVTGDLPSGGKAIWEKVYNDNKEKYGQERAAKIAWAAVKNAGWEQKKDKDGNEQWVKQNSADAPAYKDGYLPTAMLIGYAMNKGSRTQVQMDSIRAFVGENGITKPVWVQVNGSIKILDGNHRVALADELGIEQIPVRVVNSNLMELNPEAVYRRWLHEQDQEYLT